MTRYPLMFAALLGGLAFAPALPAAAQHEPICIQSTDHVLWCSPNLDDVAGEPVCIQSTDHVWCAPRPSDLLHGSPSTDAPESPEPICIYPYDGGWCTPTVESIRDAVPVEVNEICIYPYDGGWCVPWVEVGG